MTARLEHGPKGTELAPAQAGTIRLKLLRIGAVVICDHPTLGKIAPTRTKTTLKLHQLLTF